MDGGGRSSKILAGKFVVCWRLQNIIARQLFAVGIKSALIGGCVNVGRPFYRLNIAKQKTKIKKMNIEK